MKFEDLKQRLRRDREMVSVTLEIPVDVLADLERVAPLQGTSDAVALMRAYIGQGLREAGVAICSNDENIERLQELYEEVENRIEGVE